MDWKEHLKKSNGSHAQTLEEVAQAAMNALNELQAGVERSRLLLNENAQNSLKSMETQMKEQAGRFRLQNRRLLFTVVAMTVAMVLVTLLNNFLPLRSQPPPQPKPQSTLLPAPMLLVTPDKIWGAVKPGTEKIFNGQTYFELQTFNPQK